MKIRPSFTKLCLALFCLALLAACGTKGDLVMPSKAEPKTESAPKS